jgi:hypothetical protein
MWSTMLPSQRRPWHKSLAHVDNSGFTGRVEQQQCRRTGSMPTETVSEVWCEDRSGTHRQSLWKNAPNQSRETIVSGGKTLYRQWQLFNFCFYSLFSLFLPPLIPPCLWLCYNLTKMVFLCTGDSPDSLFDRSNMFGLVSVGACLQPIRYLVITIKNVPLQ